MALLMSCVFLKPSKALAPCFIHDPSPFSFNKIDNCALINMMALPKFGFVYLCLLLIGVALLLILDMKISDAMPGACLAAAKLLVREINYFGEIWVQIKNHPCLKSTSLVTVLLDKKT
jgi:hypothetical protein